MNNVAFFEIQASQPERAIAFYSALFGWTFTKQAFAPVEYWQIATAGINGGLLKRPAATPPTEYGTKAFTCSIQVENFDAAAEKILATGGSIALEKFAIPGKCWQGYFIDAENNTFGLFQVDESAA